MDWPAQAEFAVFYNKDGEAFEVWKNGERLPEKEDILKNPINRVVDVKADIVVFTLGSTEPCCFRSASGKLWCWC